MQNDLIQAAASVWIETITSDIRRSALFFFLLVIARDRGKQGLFSLCAFYVSGAQLGRDASVLCLASRTTSLAFPATVFASPLWRQFAFSFKILFRRQALTRVSSRNTRVLPSCGCLRCCDLLMYQSVLKYAEKETDQ